MNWKFPRRMTLPLIVACLVLADCSGGTTSESGSPTAFAVLRLNTVDGSPDTNFGGGRGIVTTDLDGGLFDFALAVAVEPAPSNKIVAGGSSGLAGSGLIALVRYNTDGSLDGSFGSGGIVRTTLQGVSAGASAIAVQPDGKILVAALAFTAGSNGTGISLLRYTTTGSLDPTFGTAGIVPTAPIGSGLVTDTCALALQGDGKIVVAGAAQNGDIVLYRYDTAGLLDPAFGTGGTGTTKTNLGTGGAAVSPAIALQSTGKIIVVSGTNDQVVLRYNTNGTPDNTFGTAGIVVTDAGGTDFANAVAVQADDKIVVAGHANADFNAGVSDISLVRYTVDGARDTNFGTGGIVTRDLGGRFDNVFSIALQAQPPNDPLILISGNTGSGGFSQMAVLRYNPDGTPDTTFGPKLDGVVIVSLVGPSNIASGNAVVLQPVGTGVGIVVAGYD